MTVVLVLLAAWIAAQAPAPAQTPPPPRVLATNIPFRASSAGGERTFYSVDIPANHAARLIVTQEGIDVGVLLRRRGEATPAIGLDFTSGPSGQERLYPAILDEDATWDIRVGALLPRATRADYTIVVEVKPAEAHDRAVAEAFRAYYKAQEESFVGDGPAVRRAHPYYIAAAEAALAVDDIGLAAEATFQRARMHDQFGDTPGAIEWQRRALELFRKTGQKDRLSRVLNRLGDLSRRSGAVNDAEQYFSEALPLAEAADDPVSVADILNNSGLLLLATGRPEEAIVQLEGALPLARQVNSNNVEGALLNNLSEAFRVLGMFDKGIERSLQAIPVIARLKLPRRSARTLYILAGSYLENGDRDKAEETIKQSLELYEQAQDELGYTDSLSMYARILHVSGESDRAVTMFADLRPRLQKLRNRFGEATVLALWAEVDIKRGDYDAALAKLDAALVLSRTISNRYTEINGEYLRAVAFQKLNRLDDAVTAIRRTVDAVENMRGSINRADLRTSYLATMRSYYDLYVDLLQQRGDSGAAFEVSERARARSLLEGMAESVAKIEKGADPALLNRQRAVQRELNAKEGFRAELALRDGESSAAARAAAAEVESLIEQWRSIRTQIRVTSPAYAALQQPQPINVAHLQSSLLDPQTALVAYHLGETRSYAWVIDRESIHVRVLPPMSAIDTVARRYHEALSQEVDVMTAAQRSRVTAAANAAGRELSALVWTPVAALVKGRRLLVVADRALHYVPFGALPAANGAPLLASHEVVYLPSASVLASLREDSRRVTLNAATAVFADPVFSKSDSRFAAAREPAAPSQSRAADGGLYGRLRFSRREAEAISARAPGAFQALDFAAAKSALVARDLKPFSILHFATHGSLNTAHPELSGLVFSLYDKGGKSIDGFLRLHEIYNLDLNADLVVLSACRTALGREVHGEGLIGLTRGFMYAGASRVVSSVWNVDDRASALLMSRFYDAMRTKKLAPAAALRDAQLSMLHESRWSNPHYWAAFSLQGEWK